jgi:uncharacterized protein YkwD
MTESNQAAGEDLMRRTTRVLVTTALAVGSAIGVTAPTVLSGTAAASAARVDSVRLNGFEAKLVADINAARRNAGLRTLVVVPGATDVARRWSWRMAGGEQLWHNPSIVRDMEKAGSSAWGMLAENVGYGGSEDPQSLFRAYMASPPHRANILDPAVRYLGVGVVERQGTAWNTLDFVDAYSTHYGHTRVPAAGLTMDKQRITATTDIAIFEGSADQRFGARDGGSVSASRLGFTGPSAANDAAFTVLHSTGSATGHGSVMMRDALDLSQAESLALHLSAHDPRERAVAVKVTLRRSFGDSVTLGTVHVGPQAKWVELPLPADARTFRNSVILRVGGKAVHAAGGRVRLAMYDLRAAV